MTPFEAVVRNLEQIGVDAVFGGSGEADAALLLALKRSQKIRTIVVRNEQAASFMACGYAMFSDKLGVCFSTAGPGAFNLFSGLAAALSDSLPVLALSGYVGRDFKGKGALNESSGLHRTPDSQRMFSCTTKRSYVLQEPGDTLDVLEEAVNLAFDGRPGPVHIHVSEDLSREGVDAGVYRDIALRTRPASAAADQIASFVGALGDALVRKKRVAALIGYGAIRSHAEEELRLFLEMFQIPFFTTMDAKGVLPENHPLSLGVFGVSGDPGALAYFAQTDVLLAMGNSFAQNATFGFRPALLDGKVLMHVNIDAQEIGKVYPAAWALVSDVKAALAAITPELKRCVSHVEALTIVQHKFHGETIHYSGSKIHPGQLVQVLSDYLPADSIVLGDAGSHMLWLNCYLKLDRGQNFQNPGSFGPMGTHVNGAMGVRIANPGRPVIVGCGDGAYLMAGFELLTAVEHRLPIIWIIFNNSEFNIVKYFQRKLHGEEAYVSFRNPDYVAYAEACGAKGYRVDRLEEFAAVFEKALALAAPVIIDALVDPEVFAPYTTLP